ncbi:MAG: DUF1559 domain-containing protein [Planctomycetaceae bacterium]|nr:DUF1559 domain-containing protein [Planctomycetaceae bacterium]
MKKQLILFCAVLLTILSVLSAIAQESPAVNATTDAVLAKMKPLLEDDTLAVAYVNFEKIDVVTALNNNRKFIEKVFADLGIPEIQLHDMLLKMVLQTSGNFEENWKKLLVIAETGKKILTDTCGVQEAYFVVRLGKAFNFGYVAVPKTEKLNIEQIRQLLPKDQQVFIVTRETEDYLFVSYFVSQNHKVSDAFVAQLGAGRQAERPDLLDAYNTVKGEPVQILFAVPSFVKKVVTELKPTVPESLIQQFPALETVDIPQLLNGLRFKAVGLNPEQGKVRAVVEMESELDAKQIVKQTDSILTVASDEFLKYLESLKKRNESPNGFLYDQENMWLTLYPEVFNEKTLAALKSQLLPKPDGKRFTITFDMENIGTLLSGSGITLVKLIHTSHDIALAVQKKLQCSNYIKSFLLAMHNYHDTVGKLPPAFTVDENGKPLHSWRVLLLPYLEQVDLYKSIRLDEAWDSEHNKQFHDKMPQVFKCPSCTQGNPKRDTVYCMVVGEKAVGRTDGKGIHFSKVTDGTSNTVCIVERKTPVCWMSPEDVTFDVAVKGINKLPDGIGSEHDHCVNVGFLDGSTHVLQQNVALNVLEALLTIAGGESVSRP